MVIFHGYFLDGVRQSYTEIVLCNYCKAVIGQNVWSELTDRTLREQIDKFTSSPHRIDPTIDFCSPHCEQEHHDLLLQTKA